jgi:hypothetical protein
VKKAVLLYGLAGGLLIAAVRMAEYRFLVVEHSLEIHGELVALIFAAVGIRLGMTHDEKTEPLPVGRGMSPVSAARLRRRREPPDVGQQARAGT